MQTGISSKSPCLTCVRVRDPENCENKKCKDWQAWFIDRWESMRAAAKAGSSGKHVQGTPIVVGGVKYYHPDKVREYLTIDPCFQCPWRDGLCPNPCDTREEWLASKESVNELESRSQRQTEEV